jgi:hypothetical protein
MLFIKKEKNYKLLSSTQFVIQRISLLREYGLKYEDFKQVVFWPRTSHKSPWSFAGQYTKT